MDIEQLLNDIEAAPYMYPDKEAVYGAVKNGEYFKLVRIRPSLSTTGPMQDYGVGKPIPLYPAGDMDDINRFNRIKTGIDELLAELKQKQAP
jgi:hypothetical protein